MSPRFETLRTDVVDIIVESAAANVWTRQHPADRLAVPPAMRDLMRPVVEATLTAMRAIAYAPDGFCLLDGMAQAIVAQTRRTIDGAPPVAAVEPPEYAEWDLRIAQAVVDMVLDRLAILPMDPRP